MPCYHPLQGYRSNSVNPSGKRSIVFNKNEGYVDRPVHLPCGRCIGCRLERSRQWAIRIMHEAQLYDSNSFLTLTYSDEFLPADGGLVKKHFQDFMKRVRRRIDYGNVAGLNTDPNKKVRYFHCGEYGEEFNRPHYHACMFNLDFTDKEVIKSHRGVHYYRSSTLEELWPHGHSMVGELTFESAAYVARYVVKKITGERADWYYNEIDQDTGEILRELEPEYATMSRRPGIGKEWFDKFKGDVFPGDFVVMRGHKMKPPKFYLTQLELAYPSDYRKVRGKRMVGAERSSDDNTTARLLVREEVQLERLQLLKRSYENGD